MLSSQEMKHENMAAWTPAEDRVILNTFAVEGRRWGKISRLLENRTSASVRNRFLRIEKGAKLRDVRDNLEPAHRLHA